MKKNYIIPACRVAEIENEALIAYSPGAGEIGQVDDNTFSVDTGGASESEGGNADVKSQGGWGDLW